MRDSVERSLRTLPDDPGVRLRVALILREYRQVDLAKALGINHAVLSRRINGHDEFSDDDLSRAAAFLNVPRGALGTVRQAVTR